MCRYIICPQWILDTQKTFDDIFHTLSAVFQPISLCKTMHTTCLPPWGQTLLWVYIMHNFSCHTIQFKVYDYAIYSLWILDPSTNNQRYTHALVAYFLFSQRTIPACMPYLPPRGQTLLWAYITHTFPWQTTLFEVYDYAIHLQCIYDHLRTNGGISYTVMAYFCSLNSSNPHISNVCPRGGKRYNRHLYRMIFHGITNCFETRCYIIHRQ